MFNQLGQGLFGTSVLQGAIGSAQQAQNMAQSTLMGQNNLLGTNALGSMAAQQQAYNYALSGSNTTHTGKITGEAHTPATSEELEHEAYNVAVDALIDLWVTRYGNEWTDLSEIEGEDFFRLAYRRLKQMGELETHYLTDRARYVCRRPE